MIPTDYEAEQSCVAASLQLEEAAQTCVELLTADDFWDEPLRAGFVAIAECVRTGTRPNSMIVSRAVAKVVGDTVEAAAILEAADRVLVTPYGVTFFAEIVRAKALARRLVSAAAALEMDACAGTDMELVLASHEARIAAVRNVAQFDSLALDNRQLDKPIEERLEAFIANPRAIRGICTGWGQLDVQLDGLNPQTFILIGASTSVGKSLICHNLIRQLSGRSEPEPTLLFTTEMSAEAVRWRLTWMEAGMDPQQVKNRGGMSREEQEQIWTGYATVASWPIRYRHDGSPSISSIAAEARRDAAKRGTKVVFVDHLGHVKADGRDTKERTTNVAKGLKRVTMDEGICLIATAHVNRQGTSSGTWLGLANFADSSDLEKEADVAILVTPCIDGGEAYLPIEDRRAKELIAQEGVGFQMFDIAKHRTGATGGMAQRLDWWQGGGRFTPAPRKGRGA